MIATRAAIAIWTLGLLAGCGAGAGLDVAPAVPGPAAAPPARMAEGAARARAGAPQPAVFPGKRADYVLTRKEDGVHVARNVAFAQPFAIVPHHVEDYVFADVLVSTNRLGFAAQAFRLYQAAFNRAPDPAGLGFYIAAMQHQGLTAERMAQDFIDSAEFRQLNGQLENSAFVYTLYRNILQRAPDAAGHAFWLDLLNKNTITRAALLRSFADSAENVALVAPAIEQGISYSPVIVPGAGSVETIGWARWYWKAAVPMTIAVRDSRGTLVPGGGLACATATPELLAVAADCGALMGHRLGQHKVQVTGAGVAATLPVKVVPQLKLFGTGSSSGTGSGDYNLMVTGQIIAWGSNISLLLGQGEDFARSSSLEVVVKNSAGTGSLANIASASAGSYNAMAVSDEGQVWVWGHLQAFARSGPMALPSLVRNAAGNAPLDRIVQVGVGDDNAVALADDGRVFTWGRYAGQGANVEVKFPSQPPEPAGTGGLTGFVQVTVGNNTTYALHGDGRVYAWGWNAEGQTGRGAASIQELVPGVVTRASDGAALTDIVQVVGGGDFALALTAAGNVYSWGANRYGELGLGVQYGQHYRAELIMDASGKAPLANIVMLAAGENHALALEAGGRVLSWGSGLKGALGQGLNTPRATNLRPLPVVGEDGVGELGGVEAIGAGPTHSLALRADGRLLTWGAGLGGALGQGNELNADLWSPTPVRSVEKDVPLAFNPSIYPNLHNHGR